MRQRECTEEEGVRWQRDFGEGHHIGSGDARSGRAPREGWLVDVPDDMPGENGSQYVARHVGMARQLGYTRAWEFYASRV